MKQTFSFILVLPSTRRYINAVNIKESKKVVSFPMLSPTKCYSYYYHISAGQALNIMLTKLLLSFTVLLISHSVASYSRLVLEVTAVGNSTKN